MGDVHDRGDIHRRHLLQRIESQFGAFKLVPDGRVSLLELHKIVRSVLERRKAQVPEAAAIAVRKRTAADGITKQLHALNAAVNEAASLHAFEETCAEAKVATHYHVQICEAEVLLAKAASVAQPETLATAAAAPLLLPAATVVTPFLPAAASLLPPPALTEVPPVLPAAAVPAPLLPPAAPTSAQLLLLTALPPPAAAEAAAAAVPPPPSAAAIAAAAAADDDASLAALDQIDNAGVLCKALQYCSTSDDTGRWFTADKTIGTEPQRVVVIFASGAAACSCLRLSRKGLLCRHILACYVKEAQLRTQEAAMDENDEATPVSKAVQQALANDLAGNMHQRWLTKRSSLKLQRVCLATGTQGFFADILTAAISQLAAGKSPQQASYAVAAHSYDDADWDGPEAVSAAVQRRINADIMASSRRILELARRYPGSAGLLQCRRFENVLEDGLILGRQDVSNPALKSKRTKVVRQPGSYDNRSSSKSKRRKPDP